MRVVHILAYGPPEALIAGEAPLPVVEPWQVLIRVAAIGVNPADYKWRAGMFQVAPGQAWKEGKLD
jgi:NADPH:quinone reductase